MAPHAHIRSLPPQGGAAALGAARQAANRMARIVMYTTAVCPYCIRAEQLLKRKGVATLEKIRVDLDPARRDEMLARSNGQRTVPQIFIDDFHVGGCDDLHELDRQGKLDTLLAS